VLFVLYDLIQSFVATLTMMKKNNHLKKTYKGRALVFNGTFNNISVISWQSILLAKETRVSEENHRPVASH
jgi:hypothetical protein